MLLQHHQKRLYTITTTTTPQHPPALLDNLLPPDCSVRKLFQHIKLDAAADLDNTQFHPEQAAAAALIATGPGGGAVDDHHQLLLQRLRAANQTLFLIYWHPNATEDASMRWSAFKAGANMVTHCQHAVATALQQVATQQQELQPQNHNSSGMSCTCDFCGLPGLSVAEYWQHHPLYHIHADNKGGVCQICGRHTNNLAAHIHFEHNPTGAPAEERTGVFALCISRRPSDGKFLMTQEFAGSGFWIPGGGVNPGESLTQGAVRECWEEAGVPVDLKGILDLDSHHSGAWKRVIFWGEPKPISTEPQQPQQQQQKDVSQAPAILHHQQQQQQQQESQLWPCCCPKTLPDYESAGGCWVSVDELQQLTLRSASEPCKWFPAMASGTAAAELPLYNSLELPDKWQAVFEGFPIV